MLWPHRFVIVRLTLIHGLVRAYCPMFEPTPRLLPNYQSSCHLLVDLVSSHSTEWELRIPWYEVLEVTNLVMVLYFIK